LVNRWRLAAPRQREAVHLGVEVTAVEQDEDRAVARAADGSEEQGELLIGADGLRSVVRPAIADQPAH
jgi:2-polyprenyl-6-methoxyphenol hydroxylase-like FAD-dependent oxidoreductase